MFHEIKEDIILLARPHIQNLLRMCGFKLGKVEKSKRITLLGDIQDGSDLENQLLQSKIVVLPLNDFPDNLPIIEEQNRSSPRTGRNSSTHLIETNDRDNSNTIGVNQISSNISLSTSQSARTNRLSLRLTRIQNTQRVEEECNESEDDELGMKFE